MVGLGGDIHDCVMVFKIIERIKDDTPWWCITPRMRAWYMIRELKKEREEYMKKIGL